MRHLIRFTAKVKLSVFSEVISFVEGSDVCWFVLEYFCSNSEKKTDLKDFFKYLYFTDDTTNRNMSTEIIFTSMMKLVFKIICIMRFHFSLFYKIHNCSMANPGVIFVNNFDCTIHERLTNNIHMQRRAGSFERFLQIKKHMSLQEI